MLKSINKEQSGFNDKPKQGFKGDDDESIITFGVKKSSTTGITPSNFEK